MENVINQDSVYQFIKTIIESGDVYYVDEDTHYVMNVKNDKPVAIELNKKLMPMMVFGSKMLVGDHIILNPIRDTIGTCPERQWFFNYVKLILGGMIQLSMKSIIQKIVEPDKDDQENYPLVALLAPFTDKVDTKTLNELKQLSPGDILQLFYHKKSKTAQYQTNLWDEEFCNGFGSKIRKKTWEVFREMLCGFLHVDSEDELSENYKYTATIIGTQEADAVLHVFVKACGVLSDPIKLLTGKDIHAAELNDHITHLEQYYRLCSWCASTVSKTEGNKKMQTAPWQSTVPTNNVPSVAALSTPAASTVPIIQPTGASSTVPIVNSVSTVPDIMNNTARPIVYANGGNALTAPTSAMHPMLAATGMSAFGVPTMPQNNMFNRGGFGGSAFAANPNPFGGNMFNNNPFGGGNPVGGGGRPW